MDPYFSINQVDVNKSHLSIDDENVDSFNHVVCYDSEFRDGDDADTCNTSDYISQSDYESNFRPRKWITKEGSMQDVSHKDIFSSPSKTFKAFTETVEALALQQSVIGNSNMKPASLDEIAKAISHTREKMRKEMKEERIDEHKSQNSSPENQVVETNVLEKSSEDIVVDGDHVDDVMVMVGEQAKKLIRIPQECLKTERQVKSKMVWNIAPKERPPSVNHDSELRRNILFKSFTSPQEVARGHFTLKSDSEKVETNSFVHQNKNSLDQENIFDIKVVESIKSENLAGNFDGLLIDKKYESLLRERAQMEGRIDILQVENKELLEIRSELERRLADLSARIQNMEQSPERYQQDDTHIVRNLQNQKSRLEAVIFDARRLISEKDDDLSALTSELDGNRKLVEKLEGQVLQGRNDVQNLNVTIKDLQLKVTELYVDLQTTNQNRIVSENEVQSLQGELKAALAAKEWYKEQLAACQGDKSQLQTEMTSTKSQMIRQATTIEKLKAENTRIKVNLNEMEQKLLSEKLSLARHLENIEAEMMVREALMMQSDKEYLTLKVSQEGSTEATKEEDVCSSISEGDVMLLMDELDKYKSMHEEVSQSLNECRANFAALKNSISEKQTLLDCSEVDKSSLVEEVEQLKLKLMEQVDRMDVIEQERAILEMDLASTEEEKKVIEESLSALKQNLKVVDQNFQSMKTDLIRKNEELDSLRKLLQERLETKSDNNLKEINNFSFFTSSLPENDSSRTTSTQTDVKLRNDSSADDLERMKSEKKETETKLLIVLDQLKTAQERHKHQLNVLYGVERELEASRKEVEELRERFKSSSDEIEPISDSLKCSSNDVAPSSNCSDQVDVTNVVDRKMDVEPVKCKRGGCPPTRKKSHLEGLDSRDAKSVNDNVIINGCGENVVATMAMSNNFLWRAEGDVRNAIRSRNVDGTSQTQFLLDDECGSGCVKSSELERRLVELQQKFLKAEQRAMSVEEQRNKVIFLEDQLDQANQTREVEGIRHKEEVERLGGELTSLEAEVQRLQEEILLVRHDRQNSAYRNYARDFKNAIFDKSKKKFYGAKLFEQEELDEPPSPPHHELTTSTTSTTIELLQNETNSIDLIQNNFTHEDEDLKHIPDTTNNENNQQLLVEIDSLRLQVQSLLQEKEFLAEHCQQLSVKTDRSSEENSALRNSILELEGVMKMEVERHKDVATGFERQTYELTINMQHERNVIIHNFSLELERERGKVLELLNTQNLLKEHAAKLEKSSASRESSDLRMTSVTRDQLQGRESEVAELNEKLMSMEENLNVERNQLREAKKATLIERGNNVRLKLDLEELTVHNKQLGQEVTSLREQLLALNGKVEILEQNNSKITLEVEKLTSEVKVQKLGEEKLRRELVDLRVKDATLNDQIKTLEWKLSQRSCELVASEERIVLMSERQTCEVNSLTESLKVKTSELQTIQSEMMTLTRERAELRAKIVQFKRAITDILKQHSYASEKGRMSVDELILNKEEMERLLVDALPQSVDNKPLSFLQATLSSLRGEIDSLQNQVNAHAHAVQSSSLAWRELEAQVQDLRQICRSSAASRAHSDHVMQDQLIVSALQLPADFNPFISSSSSSPPSHVVVMNSTKTSVSQVHTTNNVRVLAEKPAI